MLTFIRQDKPEESGILEHIQAEAPKEVIYQLGQLDTILFWPELKQNTPQAPRLQSQQTRPRATGALSQDLHHPPPNCMLFTKAVWLQAPLCMASSGSFANRDGGEREEQAARHAEARLATSKGCERESATRITNMLLQFNHSWETQFAALRKMSGLCQSQGFRHPRHFFKLDLPQHLETRLQRPSQKLTLAPLANLLTLPQRSITRERFHQSTTQGGQITAAPPGGLKAETCHQRAGRGASAWLQLAIREGHLRRPITVPFVSASTRQNRLPEKIWIQCNYEY